MVYLICFGISTSLIFNLTSSLPNQENTDTFSDGQSGGRTSIALDLWAVFREGVRVSALLYEQVHHNLNVLKLTNDGIALGQRLGTRGERGVVGARDSRISPRPGGEEQGRTGP